jgi:hypothetical protein
MLITLNPIYLVCKIYVSSYMHKSNIWKNHRNKFRLYEFWEKKVYISLGYINFEKIKLKKIPLYIFDKYIQVKIIPTQYWLLHRRLKESHGSNKPFQSIIEYKKVIYLNGPKSFWSMNASSLGFLSFGLWMHH